MTTMARRELATRERSWAKHLAAALAASGVTPNAVSLASIACAAAAAGAFVESAQTAGGARPAWLLVAAGAIQLRLLCNLLDGMLALEEGRQTATGVLFNEVPDRLADVLILAGAGYAARDVTWAATLGWIAAAAALFTAYVRQLGAALTGAQHFVGPMAKQHRMVALTVAACLAAVEAAAGRPPRVVAIALAVIATGSIATAWRRLARIAAQLEEA
jgi:phosphatidylglycerophosphate synthase